MKNWKLVFGVALSVLLVASSAQRGQARLVGGSNELTVGYPDAWCVNGAAGNVGSSVTGDEICVNGLGHLIPTTTNAATLGATGLIWSNVYTNAVTNSGLDTNKGIRTTALTASTTGLTVVAATGQTADLIDLSSATATGPTVRVGPGGQLVLKILTKAQIDVEVPITQGALISCSNCSQPYTLCIGTGTLAAQFARIQSGTVDTSKKGCGTNE